MEEYRVGQRWVSRETEPELGLGTIESASRHQVEIVFRRVPSGGFMQRAMRQSRESLFGQAIRYVWSPKDGVQIDSVREADRLFFYLCEGQEVPESDLADTLSFSKPEDRLIHGASR